MVITVANKRGDIVATYQPTISQQIRAIEKVKELWPAPKYKVRVTL